MPQPSPHPVPQFYSPPRAPTLPSPRAPTLSSSVPPPPPPRFTIESRSPPSRGPEWHRLARPNWDECLWGLHDFVPFLPMLRVLKEGFSSLQALPLPLSPCFLACILAWDTTRDATVHTLSLLPSFFPFIPSHYHPLLPFLPFIIHPFLSYPSLFPFLFPLLSFLPSLISL